MTIKKPKALVARIMALEQALDAERAKASKLQAELNQLHEATAKPYTLLKYVGGPFGDFETKEPGDSHLMLNAVTTTREMLVWQVVSMENWDDPAKRKVVLKFLKREPITGYGYHL